MIKKLLLFFLVIGLMAFPIKAQAANVSKMGIHILHPEEITDAKQLVRMHEEDRNWHYVTVPYTIEDIEKTSQWQKFFNEAKKNRIIPLVRLASSMDGQGWTIPNRKNTVDQISALSQFEWPTQQKHIIIYNEVNHAKEWGGVIDPIDYARVFRFASSWAHAVDSSFVVMPAAMDLAAPNGSETMEAFNYLTKMYDFDPEIFAYADAWNSHSYPNPGFAASPQRKAKNGMNGFEYELQFLAGKTEKDLQVYITETGWEENAALRRWLPAYYVYALEHIWSHDRVAAVTPFILKGSPGPFTGFSFLDTADNPTTQYRAFRSAMEKQYFNQQLQLSAAE